MKKNNGELPQYYIRPPAILIREEFTQIPGGRTNGPPMPKARPTKVGSPASTPSLNAWCGLLCQPLPPSNLKHPRPQRNRVTVYLPNGKPEDGMPRLSQHPGDGIAPSYFGGCPLPSGRESKGKCILLENGLVRSACPEILFLKKRRQQAEKAAQLNQPQQSKRVELQRLLREQELNLIQYEDTLTFRLVGRVTVLS